MRHGKSKKKSSLTKEHTYNRLSNSLEHQFQKDYHPLCLSLCFCPQRARAITDVAVAVAVATVTVVKAKGKKKLSDSCSLLLILLVACLWPQGRVTVTVTATVTPEREAHLCCHLSGCVAPERQLPLEVATGASLIMPRLCKPTLTTDQ